MIKFAFSNHKMDRDQKLKDYFWYKFNIFTRHVVASKHTILVAFDMGPSMKGQVSPDLGNQALRTVRSDFIPALLDAPHPSSCPDPYWIHSLLMGEVLARHDEAVWNIRELVREIELNRVSPTNPNPDYTRLHEISRHAIHVSETLDLAVRTTESMISAHEQLWKVSLASKDEQKNKLQITRRLQFFEHGLRSLRWRAASNKERLLNEIQFAFHTVSQYDARTSVKIGRAAQEDSSAMKTISILTLVFLPATFISAVFSMSFFDYNADSGEWSVSEMFWFYWVIAVPFTIFTGLLWFFGGKLFPQAPLGQELLDRTSSHIWKEHQDMMAILREKSLDIDSTV